MTRAHGARGVARARDGGEDDDDRERCDARARGRARAGMVASTSRAVGVRDESGRSAESVDVVAQRF